MKKYLLTLGKLFLGLFSFALGTVYTNQCKPRIISLRCPTPRNIKTYRYNNGAS
ncbi:hypothetical protein [Clostridium botulinum]|uniref:Lipoprotein n=1 Tax=Clostridium botulinum TaxID=1491 RepID=A0ABD7CLY7_CLOBO|nr:hypothetical protein [Clostridium botulinum]MCC5427127.1 hypothetical protein [Clostridium botulinum]QRI54191.1 hypothetical protein JQS73_03480 [Clostridium botulinum]